MEKRVFPLPEVSAELDKTIEARLHTDDSDHGETNRKLQARFAGVVTNPYYVILDPKTEKEISAWGEGKAPADVFAAWLRQALGGM